MKIPITHIGRYYKTQLKCLIDFIELISEDLVIYKIELEKQIRNAFGSYWGLGRAEMEGFYLQVEEALKEN